MRVKKVSKNTRRKGSKRSSHLGNRAEKKLGHLASFPQMNPNPVVEVSADGFIEYINPAAQKLFPDLQEMGQQHEWLVDLESIVTLLKEQKKPYHVRELKVYGKWYHQSFHLTPWVDHIRIYGFDITDRKHAEEERVKLLDAVQEEKDRLSALINSMTDEVWFADTSKKFTLANPTAARQFGIDPASITDVEKLASSLEVYRADGSPRPPEDTPPLRALAGNIVINEEEIIRTPNTGELRHRQVSSSPVRDSGGNIIGSVSVVRDISEGKRLEEALRESESKYRSLFNNMINGFAYHKVLFDDEGEPIDYVFLEVNDAFENLTGLKRENLIGRSITEVLPGIEHDPADWIGTYGKVALSGGPVRFETYAEALRKWYAISAYSPEKGHFASVFEDITERKQMEGDLCKSRDELKMRVQQRTAELAKANELLERMFSSIGMMIAYMDKDFNFIRVNRAYAEADEREPEFYVGKNHFALFPNEENEKIFRKTVETGEPYSVYAKPFEYAEHPERGVTHWDWSLQPVKDPDGSVGGVVLSLVNVTERIRAEESVHQQTALLELAHDAIIIRDIEDRILFWNHGAEELYGWEKSEALEKAAHDILQTEFPILLDEIKIDLIRRGKWEGELVHTRRDGKKINVESRWVLQKGKEGRPTLILNINRDITERKRAQETVEAERQRFNDVLEILPAYLVLLSPDYHVPFANRFFRERFGESHGQRCFEYLFGRSEPCETCESYTALKTMSPHQWEWTGPDCHIYDVFDFPFTDTDGSTLILEMGIDITERKQAQEALRAASLYTRSLIEASLDPLVTISADGKIMDVNSATELTTGVPRDKLIGTDFSDYFTEPEKAREGYQRVFREGFVRDYPLAIRHTSGKVTDVLYHATVFRNEAGEIQGVFAAARDITARRRAEKALQESENRLRLLSSQLINVQEAERKRIAREIHDSIGQTLAAIKFGLESKLSQMGGGAAPPPGVSIENIIALAQNGIEESRRIQMDLRPSILDDLGILATIGWFTREFQKVYSHISVEKHISIEENEIPDSLKTALFRVMQEAMNNITKHSKANLIRLILKKAEDKIALSVEDNGEGFDLEKIKQGLGLTSMRERTELSGGVFEAESMPGTGTIIKASWAL